MFSLGSVFHCFTHAVSQHYAYTLVSYGNKKHLITAMC